jgi:hypothetical protein
MPGVVFDSDDGSRTYSCVSSIRHTIDYIQQNISMKHKGPSIV